MLELLRQHRQAVTYLTGGVLSALVDVGLMQLLLVLGAPLVAAVSAGFAASLLFNFLFHARLTFKGSAGPAALLRYLCVVGVNYLLTLACVSAGVALCGLALPGKLVALPLVALSGYLAGKYWIFRP